MINLVITGASGFLGKRILKRSIDQGVKVHALGRTPVGEAANFTKMDIRDRGAVAESLRAINPTHILHLASMGVTRDNSSLQDMLLANTVATDNILDAAANLPEPPAVVMMGSAYEYRSSDKPLTEDSTIDPKSPYVISKTASAFCMSRYADVLPMLYLRLFNVYGPGEPSGRIIPLIVDCARRGVPIGLTSCQQLRDFMFVDDLVDIVFRLVASVPIKTGAEVLNIGTGTPITLETLVRETVEQLRVRGVAAKVEFGALSYRKDDPMFCYADISRLLGKIGSYKFTSYSEGVGATVESLL